MKKFVPYKSQLLSDIEYDYLTDPKPPPNRAANENKEILFKEKILREAASVKTVNLSSTQEGNDLSSLIHEWAYTLRPYLLFLLHLFSFLKDLRLSNPTYLSPSLRFLQSSLFFLFHARTDRHSSFS